ncbi:Transposase [Snodgrassella alvi SCGC AB-598-O02]|nr:Transposase [Snodgrassella alvi SCGC AB-598-O02]KES11314.1 Transposase [Snodgrassella alvi SCGC AB-598-O02]
MKKFSEHQIVSILKEAEVGIPIKELCRKYGMAFSTFYKWRDKYGGMQSSDIKRLKQLEAENRKLKQMYAELSLTSQLQQEIIKKL